MKTMQRLAHADRPREKLYHKGLSALTDLELIAALIGSGGAGADVFAIARKILKVLDANSGLVDPSQLDSIPGVGKGKASQVLAGYEFWRRRLQSKGRVIRAPADILPLVGYLAHRKQEYFLSITLNGAQELISSQVISVGLVDQAQIHPREVFANAIQERASALIVAHNHPSGFLEPSDADKRVTHQLSQAGSILGIPLYDHIIFYADSFWSFRQNGLVL